MLYFEPAGFQSNLITSKQWEKIIAEAQPSISSISSGHQTIFQLSFSLTGFPLYKPGIFLKVIDKSSAYWQLGKKGGSQDGGDSGQYIGSQREMGDYTLSHSKAAAFGDLIHDI